MFTLHEQPETLQTTIADIRAHTESFWAVINPNPTPLLIPANTDFASAPERCNKVFRLTDGNLGVFLNDKPLYYFGEGDLVGLHQLGSEFPIRISSEFAVRGEELLLSDLKSALEKDSTLHQKFNKLLVLQNQFLSLLVSLFLRDEVVLTPEVKSYTAGSVVIQQGTTAKEVYTLLEGELSASVDGVVVGDIRRDEIFGMLAAITGTSRTATVTASKDSMVIAVPQEKFVELIESKPSMVLKLLEDMSRLIVSLNEKVVANERRTPI